MIGVSIGAIVGHVDEVSLDEPVKQVTQEER
jgi:hypothetical protein